jgi:hypothetical protein
MNELQRKALQDLCSRYKVEFDEGDYLPTFDLPKGWVAGWVGGSDERKLYVGCSPNGEINS